MFFGAKFQGNEKAYKVNLFEKNPINGVKDANGQLVWVLYEAQWSTFTAYENLSYKAIALGTLKFDGSKFVGKNSWGLGVGAKGNSTYITDFIKQVTNNQIYGVFDYSRLT